MLPFNCGCHQQIRQVLASFTSCYQSWWVERHWTWQDRCSGTLPLQADCWQTEIHHFPFFCFSLILVHLFLTVLDLVSFYPKERGLLVGTVPPHPHFCLPLYFLPAVCTTELLPWAFLFCHDLKRWYRTYSPDNCACAASLRQTPLKFTWPFQIAFFTTLPMKTLLSTAFVIQVHPSHFILVTQQSLKI